MGVAFVAAASNPGQGVERFVTGATDASSLLEAAASEFNLWVSLHRVVLNKGAPGVDGVSAETVLAKSKELLPRLRCQLPEGSYRPATSGGFGYPSPAVANEDSRLLEGQKKVGETAQAIELHSAARIASLAISRST